MRVRELMTADPVCCTADTPIENVARLMADRDCGAIPIVGDLETRMPLGIITDRDIVIRGIAAGRDSKTLTARDCMTSPVVTVVADASVRDCVELLELTQIRRLLVVDDAGKCCGIVAQADIARNASKRETGELLREVSKPSVPAFTS